MFSNDAIWTVQNGVPMVSLRLGNVRTNRVFEGRAKLTLLRDEVSREGEKLRRQIDLKLIRDQTAIFSLSWTLYHVIDETSPLFEMTPEKIRSTRLGAHCHVHRS